MKKIFEKLPMLETEMLVLRPVEEADYKAMFEHAGDPEVAKYTSWEAHKNAHYSKTIVQFMMKSYK